MREPPQESNKINEEEFDESFNYMQESVAVNFAKHIMNRAYTLGGPCSNKMPLFGDDYNIEALKCIWKILSKKSKESFQIIREKQKREWTRVCNICSQTEKMSKVN